MANECLEKNKRKESSKPSDWLKKIYRWLYRSLLADARRRNGSEAWPKDKNIMLGHRFFDLSATLHSWRQHATRWISWAPKVELGGSKWTKEQLGVGAKKRTPCFLSVAIKGARCYKDWLQEMLQVSYGNLLQRSLSASASEEWPQITCGNSVKVVIGRCK